MRREEEQSSVMDTYMYPSSVGLGDTYTAPDSLSVARL